MRGSWRNLFPGSVLLLQTSRNGRTFLQILIAHRSHPLTELADGQMDALEGSWGEIGPVVVEMDQQSLI